MPAGQDVLSRSLDVAALNAVQTRLELREVERSSNHAGTLRDVLDLHRIHRLAGFELNTIAQAAIVLGGSEHRAQELLDEALTLLPLPGALEALECGLTTVEQSAKLVRHLEPLPLEHRLGVWARLQARLAADAACGAVLPPARLSDLLRHWVRAADPAAAIARRKQAEAGRKVDYRRREDGLNDLYLLGGNSPDTQAALSNIRRNAVRVGPDDDRTRDQLRYDAAMDLLTGRSALPFDEQQTHCQPGCDCRPGQPAPCGADITLLVPLGAALGTTDELAELVGHGPIEPDLLHDLLMAPPQLRAVFVDEDGTPVADSPRAERPPRNDPAAVRAAILRLADSPPGPWQPRHVDDHAPPPPDRSPFGAVMTLLRQLRERARAAAEAAPPVLLGHAHPQGTPRRLPPEQATGPVPACPRSQVRVARLRRPRRPLRPRPRPRPPPRTDLPLQSRPLCRRHHRVKQNGWLKLRARDSSVRWTSPSGRTWTSPSQHQPPQPAVRSLSPMPVPSELDELSPLNLEHELWALDPGSPIWGDPTAHELRAEDLEPHQVDEDPPRGTRWSTDLDDPYAWLDLLEPTTAAP